MYLERVDIQGFKTFAKRTALAFPGPEGGSTPITCIVGPNGSGKSNIADAIRWALGEQSLKTLRGKDSQDIIFSGSQGKSRAGFAEVTLTFNNEDRAMESLATSQVTFTRRLFRDGTSNYLVNGDEVRLSDMALLLAEANVGQRSYAVVGQGMIDHILVASPEERKSFFDDATGVKPLQLKRHEALLKLHRTEENLKEAHVVLEEIEPRLRLLKRQVARLEDRDVLEQELRDKQLTYYVRLWQALSRETEKVTQAAVALDAQVAGAQAQVTEGEAVLTRLASSPMNASGEAGENLQELQIRYRNLQATRTRLRDERFQLEQTMERQRIRAEASWSPLPLPDIISELVALSGTQEEFVRRLRSCGSFEEVTALLQDAPSMQMQTQTLLSRLRKPDARAFESDPAFLKQKEALEEQEHVTTKEIQDVEGLLETYAAREAEGRREFVEQQRALHRLQQELHVQEGKRNEWRVEQARLEERRAHVEREMQEEAHLTVQVVAVTQVPEGETEGLHRDIQRLKEKVSLIGSIDPEVVAEFTETKNRFETLERQVQDLEQALLSTRDVLRELQQDITAQTERAFAEINREFSHFFALLFGGGSCKLTELTAADREQEEEHVEEETTAFPQAEFDRDRVIGIDIQATPPGKKLKALNLLSGGERALTAIALLCAIMAVNPSPFVILDEVDAALDEANTIRFAEILKELQKRSQFIVITHNRATMETADVLFGVTMAEDGVSSLLSVKLEDVVGEVSARR